MFRKKPEIPPRPKLPTIEQIVDDIEHSTPQDVAFKNCDNEAPVHEAARKDSSTPEAAYIKLKNFVEVNSNLKESLQKLHDQSEALKISDLELKALADDIRKQALEALQ